MKKDKKIKEHLFEDWLFKLDEYVIKGGKMYRVELSTGTLHRVGKG